MVLEKFKDLLYPCLPCGACAGRGPDNPFAERPAPSHRCPTLERYHFASYSARGKLYLTRLMYYENLPKDKLVNTMFKDPDCGACESSCSIPFTDIWQAAREEIVISGLQPRPIKLMETRLTEKHNVFGALSEVRNKWSEGLKIPEESDISYFAGCYASYRQPEIARAVMKILKIAGINATILKDEWCCGFPARRAGSTKIAKSMAQHNLDLLTAKGTKRVIFSCAECYRSFKKDYPEILGANLPFEVMHLSQFVKKLIEEKKISFNKELKARVTYHDPCHLGRHLKIYDEPREVIKAIPGIKFKEMEANRKWAWCCGAGEPAYSVSTEFARWVAKERLLQAKKVADELITACPRCIENLRSSAVEHKLEMATYDLSVFILNALTGVHA